MRVPQAIVVIVCLLFRGVAVFGAGEASGSTLSQQAVRDIFRIVVGQPQLADAEIGVSLDVRGQEAIWTCIWSGGADGGVTLLQVRDRDGAYRQPEMTDLSSLKFGIRLDLRERIARIVADARERRPESQDPAAGGEAGGLERNAPDEPGAR